MSSPAISENIDVDSYLFNIMKKYTPFFCQFSKISYIDHHLLRGYLITYHDIDEFTALQAVIKGLNRFKPQSKRFKVPEAKIIPSPGQINNKAWQEYVAIIASLDQRVVQENFNDEYHMLLDLRLLGSLLNGAAFDDILSAYSKLYFEKDIPKELLIHCGVREDLLNSLASKSEPCKKVNKNLEKEEGDIKPKETEHSPPSLPKGRKDTKTSRQLKSYYFQCNDESFQDAVDASLKNYDIKYTWSKPKQECTNVYFFRFDNRNTFLKELDGLSPATIIVAGYFLKKISEVDKKWLDKEFSSKFDKVVQVQIRNDDHAASEVSVLRIENIEPILLALNQ